MIPKYVLITPARNEDSLIEKTIEAVTSQTTLPAKWVIVNDGSTDRTAAIVRSFLPQHPWIELLEMPSHRDRSFGAKAHCFNAGYARVKEVPFDVIGNLDADITFEADYLEFLLKKFEQDSRLGVAGTVFIENGYSSETNSFEGQKHVAGGCQLFRRECFDEVGGYVPTKIGLDWIAVATARMKGWTTRSFREKAFLHHRPLGSAGRTRWAAAFMYGEKDYRLGWHPVWQLCRVAYQVKRSPFFGVALAAGYFMASIKRIERPVSPELVKFHRAEQIAQLKSMLKSVLTLKRFDRFEVTR